MSSSGSNSLACIRVYCTKTHSATSVRRGNLALGNINDNAGVRGVCILRDTSSTVRFFNKAIGMAGLLTMGPSSSVFSFARKCDNALGGYCNM